jgi:hypothetical protein
LLPFPKFSSAVFCLSSVRRLFLSLLYKFIVRLRIAPNYRELLNNSPLSTVFTIILIRHLRYSAVHSDRPCCHLVTLPLQRPCSPPTAHTARHGSHLLQTLLWVLLPKCSLHGTNQHSKAKVLPLYAWTGPERSRKTRLPDYMTTAQDGGKAVSPTHRPPLPPGNTPGTHFC